MIKVFGNTPNIQEYIQNIYCLDNFSAFGLILYGKEFKTAEHAFQYSKFKDTAPKIAEEIKNCLSPFEARELAHKYKSKRREDWSSIKYEIMEKVILEKALQNDIVSQKLIATKDLEIIEDCGEDDDKDWGCGLDGTGNNNLGKILMKIRSTLIQQ